MRTIAQFGFGVWMQIGICLVSVIYAALFAVRGGARRFRVLGALTAGLVFATAGSVCMGVAAAAASGARGLSASEPGAVAGLVGGLGEAAAGGLMGFASLTLVAVLVAAAFARGVSVRD